MCVSLIKDILNILGRYKRTFKWQKPSGAMQVQVSWTKTAYNKLTVRFGNTTYVMDSNFHAFNISPDPMTFYFDCVGKITYLTVNGEHII